MLFQKYEFFGPDYPCHGTKIILYKRDTVESKYKIFGKTGVYKVVDFHNDGDVSKDCMFITLENEISEEITISHLFVAAMFGMMIYGLMLLQYPKAMMNFAEQLLKDKGRSWLTWVLLVILAIWVLIKVFS